MAAANVFSTGTDMVAKATDYSFRKIKGLMRSVIEFLEGIWDKVGMAYDSVKSFIGGAINAITGGPSRNRLVQPSTNESGL